MSDLISRQDALEAIKYAELGMEYEAVETIPPTQQWILCSERLPEERKSVLTWMNDDYYEINHLIDSDNGEWFLDGVVAWMPLPTPYTESEVRYGEIH